MDTHVTTSPVFVDSPTLRARLPGEPDDGVSVEGTLPPLHGEKREAPPPGRGRRHGLLAGVAIIGIVVIAGGGFLVSHAEMQAPAHAPASAPAKVAAGRNSLATLAPGVGTGRGAQPGVVAPAAALAPIQAPPPPAAVVQPPYKPAPQNTEMAELLDLQHEGTPEAPSATPHIAPHTLKVQPSPAHPAKSDAASEHPAPLQIRATQAGVPPGFVAHEPGALADPAPQKVQSQAKIADPVHASAEAAPPATKVPEPTVKAATPPLAPQPSASVPPHAPPLHAAAAAAGQGDVLVVSRQLEAAPMAPQQQIQVLEVVTQLATLIRDQRLEIANLQADVQTSQKATAAKLGDFERRLALVEAGSALAAASKAPASAAAPIPSAAPGVSAATVALTSAKVALAAASGSQAAEQRTPASAPAQASSGAPEQYRVQAASPGLAMLAEIDHSGGDGAQQEVQVGDVLPGYGRVLSVSQRGTAWVVKTEHGTIQ